MIPNWQLNCCCRSCISSFVHRIDATDSEIEKDKDGNVIPKMHDLTDMQQAYVRTLIEEKAALKLAPARADDEDEQDQNINRDIKDVIEGFRVHNKAMQQLDAVYLEGLTEMQEAYILVMADEIKRGDKDFQIGALINRVRNSVGTLEEPGQEGDENKKLGLSDMERAYVAVKRDLMKNTPEFRISQLIAFFRGTREN